MWVCRRCKMAYAEKSTRGIRGASRHMVTVTFSLFIQFIYSPSFQFVSFFFSWINASSLPHTSQFPLVSHQQSVSCLMLIHALCFNVLVLAFLSFTLDCCILALFYPPLLFFFFAAPVAFFALAFLFYRLCSMTPTHVILPNVTNELL